MAKLEGADQLRARLRAIRESWKPIGRDWADETVRIAKATGPWRDRTGNLRRSIRRKNSSLRKASVVAHYSQYFIDSGTKQHEVRTKRKRVLANASERTVFGRRAMIPRKQPRPFRTRVALQALERHSMAESVIEAWNSAGGRVSGRGFVP